MLEAPGGGGGTPWESMSVTEMQALIQNPDTNRHYDLLDGWKKSAELVVSHRFQVQSYRDNLAAVWPPAKSPASAAYLARLDLLIDNLTETYEAALANHDALASATLSISLAQQRMEQIHQEYTINQQLLLDFSAKQQEQQNSPTPQPSPGPSGAEPPVAPDRQEALRQQAVTLLSSVSSDLAQAQVRLVQPTPYAQKFTDDTKQIIDGQTFTAPPIPPITPIFAEDARGSASSRQSSVATPGSPGGVQVGTQQPGLVLGGANVPTAPPMNGLNNTLPTPPGGLNTNPGVLPPVTNTFLSNGGTAPVPPTTGVGRGIGVPRGGLIHPGTPAAGGLRGIPSGGVIGGIPGGGLGQPGVARPAARRVNPVGGVIGEAASNSTGRTAARGMPGGDQGTYGASYGQSGSRKTSRNEQNDATPWDPDNPWQTAEGVDPVVLPAREQPIDPGPAIGLR